MSRSLVCQCYRCCVCSQCTSTYLRGELTIKHFHGKRHTVGKKADNKAVESERYRMTRGTGGGRRAEIGEAERAHDTNNNSQRTHTQRATNNEQRRMAESMRTWLQTARTA